MWLPSKGHHKVLEINNIKVVQSETAKKPKGDGDLCQECLCYIAQLRQKQQRSRKATGMGRKTIKHHGAPGVYRPTLIAICRLYRSS
jgi:hypothetical protein